MAKIKPNVNVPVDAMLENIKRTMNLFDSSPALENAVKKANISNRPAIQVQAILEQFNNIFSGNDRLVESFQDTLRFRSELLRSTQNFYFTEAVHVLRDSLLHNNYFSAIEAISNSLTSEIIEAPDIALLKLNKQLLDLSSQEIELPRGLRTAIDTLHTKTAISLSTTESLGFKSEDVAFFVKSSPDDSCKSKEINVVSSVARLFHDLTEDELIKFLCHLSSHQALGPLHPVGKKIIRIVEDINTTISFDSEFFYHARSLDDNVAPYTDEDMTCAPHGITSYGRFNHIGDNYYYFSDQKRGAVEEVRIHNPNNRVQVAKLKPKGRIRMVDISQSEENVFLKYCRFPFDPTSNKKVPREYLIPAFFSDCCKLHGFDGIKYYGTQIYKNYVTWKDKHFTFIGHEIIEKPKV